MSEPTSKNRIHPLVATAAVAVTLVCLVGVAAITGLIPNSQSTTSPPGAAMSAPNTGYANNAPEAAQNTTPTPTQMANQSNSQMPAQQSNYATGQPAVQQNYADEQRPSPIAQTPVCNSCGRVESIQAVQQAVKPSGVGVAAGALLGGILGHQVGHGNGNTLATVAGAVGGGFAGNEVERRTRTTTSYQVHVRMENGKMRSFPQSAQEWRVGDPVRVVNGHLEGRG
ncbi:glycine zipper 2TM domain-containing protein [Glaciimonas sp. GG7]